MITDYVKDFSPSTVDIQQNVTAQVPARNGRAPELIISTQHKALSTPPPRKATQNIVKISVDLPPRRAERLIYLLAVTKSIMIHEPESAGSGSPGLAADCAARLSLSTCDLNIRRGVGLDYAS